MWVLILFAHVGPMGQTDSNSITSVEYTSKVRCEAAGKAASDLAKGTYKQIKYTCTEK